MRSKQASTLAVIPVRLAAKSQTGPTRGPRQVSEIWQAEREYIEA